jgi:hypothetical protein
MKERGFPAMPPVKTSAPHPDVDNEATAELPVLDVAAYEATLDTTAHTDNWVVPGDVAGAAPSGDATAQMPVVVEAIPTLRPAESVPAYDLDHSGTHEMPAFSRLKTAKPIVVPGPARAELLPPITELPVPAVPPRASVPHAPITVPPSPPMIEELRHALASAERRIEELQERARIADTERNVAVARANAEATQLREQLGQHLEALHTARERLGVQGADQYDLEDELFARADRIKALEQELAIRRRLFEEKLALLEAAHRRCETLDADGLNLRAAIARRDAQIGILEADMQARAQRESQMSVRLSDALAATDPHVPQMRAELVAREEDIRRLTAEIKEWRARLSERDDDLQVAEESIRNLEIEVREKSGKLAEANVTVEEWRAVIAESQRSILERDNRIQRLESDLERRQAPGDLVAQTSEQEVALEGPARVLIRTDGNTDFVHVLGRRTRIGRGPDNELVLDTKHVSRYHAVLLAGPAHTSIEDLNSTNGVFVNGRRIARQVLKDGDRVTIGRSQFRYTVRS